MGRTPVCVYVLFHPKGPEGAPLARSLFDWLRLKVDTGDGLATGLPVYYRAVVEKERFQPSIDWEGADRSVVVVLVDDHMATDGVWRRALKAVQAEAMARDALFLPVMVDRSLDQLAFLSERYQPVRIYDPADPVLPPPGSGEPAARAELERERIRLRAGRLRRGVTEAIARTLRKDQATGKPNRLRVFVSHAKADGAEIAARVRDGLASVSQLESWFDVNDLASGSIWRQPIEKAAGNSSGGMIAVLTDAYPTRPWCRLEARAARTPVRSRNLKNLYKAQPLVAVHLVGTRWTRAVGPLAQVPHIGWPTDPSDPVRERRLQQDRIVDVVDRLLLEVLLAGLMRSVATAHPDAVVLDFVPDAWSLAEIHKQLDRKQEPIHILYPGHGLRPAEREELERVVSQLFPRGSSLDAVEERNLGLGPAPRPEERRDVAISTGGESEELWREGLGLEHVNDLLLRLTRQLLSRGHRCVFGGALNQQDSFTASILDTAEAWSREQPVEVPNSAESLSNLIARGDAAIDRPPVLSHLAWPYSKQLSLKAQARCLGICDFIVHDRVEVLDLHRYATMAEFSGAPPSPDMPISELDQKFGGKIQNLLVAESLAAMRREISRTTHVRVLVAGKIHGWSGWLPGIAEELLGSISLGRPVLLVGAFGGCAKVIADFLLNPKAAYPAELGYEAEWAYRKRLGQERAWLELGTTEELRRRRFADLEAALQGLRADLWPDQLQAYAEPEDERCATDLVLGLPRQAWIELARETGATAVISRVLRLVEGL